MIGAGVLAAFAPAAGAVWSGLLLALAVAAVVAYANATSSARLAVLSPESGGAYVFGRERLGPLLSLLLGVSRTILAMARDAHLPRTLAAVHPRYRGPHHAELAVGAVVIVLVLVADVRSAIGFSSFTLLAYYAVANASALTVRQPAGSVIVPSVGWSDA